ncbi:MAG: SDR family NAD(P)-dependent oxidoreductase, partial [Acidimicrobiales bacterium]
MLSRLSRTLEGRVALVTGAAGGMGRATAFVLSDLGARVGLLDRSASVADAAAVIAADGGTAAGWQLDVTDADACAPAVTEATGQLGRV